ncbi:MAG: helix-turn-helix transcriptional regulator [Candidatus Kariarchaeaceae archaeon]|jgi:DNA-binding transcriptional ArsR family regulator
MNSRKAIIALMLITAVYSVVYIMTMVITSIINGELPFEQHSHNQMLGILFIFSMGILTGGLYLTYFYPELREKFHGKEISSNPSSLEVLLYVSTDNEIKIIRSIQSLAPKAYKFEIARETGLSRMQVHRALMRLNERGIVRIIKDGRYSQVYLMDWIQ